MIVIPIKTEADFAAAAVPAGSAMLFVELSGSVLSLKYRLPDGTVATIAGVSGSVLLPPATTVIPSDQDGDLLHMEIQFANNSAFSGAVGINTAEDTSGCYVFASDQYLPFPEEGVGAAYYGSRVMVLRPTGTESYQYTRCRWFDGIDYTPWEAL